MATEEEAPTTQTEAGPGAALAAILIVGAVLVGLVFLVKGLYPDELPTKTDPSFIDSVFQNKLVVWFARLLLVSGALVLAFGGAFIIASTVVRMKHREWLRRAGPFEVSETAVTELEDQVAFWRTAALEGQDQIAELRERLEESDGLIEELHLAMDEG